MGHHPFVRLRPLYQIVELIIAPLGKGSPTSLLEKKHYLYIKLTRHDLKRWLLCLCVLVDHCSCLRLLVVGVFIPGLLKTGDERLFPFSVTARPAVWVLAAYGPRGVSGVRGKSGDVALTHLHVCRLQVYKCLSHAQHPHACVCYVTSSRDRVWHLKLFWCLCFIGWLACLVFILASLASGLIVEDQSDCTRMH